MTRHPTPDPGPLLRATGLRRVFGSVAAIDGVDLVVEPGARHALIGPNGAGKTTLLDLLAGTQPLTSGRILFNDRAITRRNTAYRARAGIRRSFQTPTVIPTLSTLDNLILGAWPHTHRPWWPPARYRRLLTRAMHQLDTLGLANQADTAAGALSHGQRRLLDIAIALAGSPRLLLLDEPAAGLDSDTDLNRLLDLLHALPKQMAVVLVEHHLDVVAAFASSVTVLDHGRVLATGTHHQIATHPAVQAAYPSLTLTTVERERHHAAR